MTGISTRKYFKFIILPNIKIEVKLENFSAIFSHLTLNAFEIVALIKSRTQPPANVPKIPHTIVIPPNVKSAFFCQKE